MKKRCPNGTRKNKKTGNCEPTKIDVKSKKTAEKKDTETMDEQEDKLYHIVYYADIQTEINEKILASSGYLYDKSKKFTDADIMTTFRILKATFSMSLSPSDNTKLARAMYEYEQGKRTESATEAKKKQVKSILLRRLNSVMEEDAVASNIDDSAIDLVLWLQSI